MTSFNLPVNQILHGDTVEVMSTLPSASIDLIFADPPYNMQLNRELVRPDATLVDAVNDPWDQFKTLAEYDAFTRAWLTECRRLLKDDATLWVIGSYHNIYRVGSILMDLGYWILNDIVWIKANPTPQMKGVRFCNAHETLLWVAKSRSAAQHYFNYHGLKAGNEDRQMRSDWYFPVCGGRERIRVDGVKAHTTQKPKALLHQVIVSSSQRGDLVLDPFCGTGTTAAVAKHLGRNFITIDREERYVEVARRRVETIETSPHALDAPMLNARRVKVSFASLVKSGLIAVGTELVLKGNKAIAIVQEDGTIVVDGLRGSIHKMGARCLKVPECNGWEHWTFYDPEANQHVLINELRVRIWTQQQAVQATHYEKGPEQDNPSEPEQTPEKL